MDMGNLRWELRISVVLVAPCLPRSVTDRCKIEEMFRMLKLSVMAVRETRMWASTMQIFTALEEETTALFFRYSSMNACLNRFYKSIHAQLSILSIEVNLVVFQSTPIGFL